MRRGAAVVLALASAGALAIGLALDRAAVLRGWLLAFIIAAGIPIGGLVLMLVHRLVGGAWGEALRPTLTAMTRLMPLAALAVLPLLLDLSAVYPWAADPASAPADVARLYLNPPGFLARSLIALAGWSVLALLATGDRCPPATAAAGLVFHGIAVSLISVDWVLSVEPGVPSSSFAAGIAVQQLVSALAVAALLAPADAVAMLPTGEPERSAQASAAVGRPVAHDLLGLLLAALLGLVYLDFMAYLVAWYGNLPDKAGWYLRRAEPGWAGVIAAALALGAVVPIGLILSGWAGRNRTVMRATGGLVLVGVALHSAWLVGPLLDGPRAIGAAVLAMILLATAAAAAVASLRLRSSRKEAVDAG